MRAFKSPHSYGLLLANEGGPADKTIQIQVKFNKVNYRIEGEADDLCDLVKVLKPGADIFLRLEKIDEAQDASVRISCRYCVGIDKEKQE